MIDDLSELEDVELLEHVQIIWNILGVDTYLHYTKAIHKATMC